MPPKILLAEDDPQLAETVKQYLVFHKFVVKTVDNGTDAIEQLQFGKFDLVVLDWHLPGMDGVEICRQFRGSGGTTPIMMLSGNDTGEHRQQGLDAGANDYMKKPFEFKELTERLKKLLPESC